MTHTPGPWSPRERQDDCPGLSIVPANGGMPIAIVPVNKRRSAEVDANAYLMAAAPDMYEALTMAEKRLSELNNSPTALSFVHAALAKATNGGTP